MTSGAAALLRRPEEPRAAFLELFFDLVFVFTLAALAAGLARNLSWRGAFHTLVLLLALWLVWTATSGLTDRLDPQHPVVQLLVLATMFGTLVMAAAAPKAFDGRGFFFAGTWIATQIGPALLVVVLLRGHEASRAFVRVLFWHCVAAVPLIVGAFTHVARDVLWASAVGLECAALALGLPTPRLGRAYMRPEFAISGEHLAERYRQLFIVGLGELILVTGLTFSGSEFGSGRIAAVVVAFATTALLWRIYIHRAGSLLAVAIGAASDPVRASIWALYSHLLMVAGIVPSAIAVELVIAHPFGDVQPAWIAVILGGPTLFLAGRGMFEYAVFGRVSRNRVIGAILLVAGSPAMMFLPPLLVAVVPALVLAWIAVSDGVRARGRPPELPAPPL
ncbi:low temperature requirement protein A [Micromonospora sp. 15K316]|uniref:low temperature requirement protein A n=1 Tax=Micromonospora sp. 15K316 TaxID=2530376 RepID=UPI0010468D01|nr:low temperature requirement protein A [Micromonospora sp. 15K316]TDC35951.1 low temperature requirement protein A [Micromonospora sp. 15K316]